MGFTETLRRVRAIGGYVGRSGFRATLRRGLVLVDEMAGTALPVSDGDLLAPRTQTPAAVARDTVDFVLPPIQAGHGGPATVMRIVGGLEARGLRCRLLFDDPRNVQSVDHVRRVLAEAYPRVIARVSRAAVAAPYGRLVATSWPTAYKVRSLSAGGRAAYLVQDFEPDFYPAGALRSLAEATYGFGLHGLAMGRWLAEVVARHGMTATPLPFGVDASVYHPLGLAREGVFFYTRPSTPRRGFELGVVTLRQFHTMAPHVPIHLVGATVGGADLGFPYTDHGSVRPDELNQIYNRCRAGLILSFTNVSLIPLEARAAGCTPVVNDHPSAHGVLGENAVIAAAPPDELADALRRAYAGEVQLPPFDPARHGWERAIGAAAEALDAL